jgi:diacylglycerol kinase (ATP)
VVTGLVTRFPDVAAPHPIPVPVAVLPFGTGNDVARLLGVYEDEQVLAAMQLGQTERWDVLDVESRTTEGEWEHHYALLFVACGFAGDLLRHTTPWVKRVFGSRLAYPVGFMRGLMRFRPFQMRIRTVDREWKGEWVVALAANAPMAGGGTMQIAPGALPGDGKIHVSLIQAVTRWELFRQFERFVRGRHIGHRKVEYFATDNLEVAAEPPVAVAADGDLLGCSPMRVQLLRGRVQFYSGNRV